MLFSSRPATSSLITSNTVDINYPVLKRPHCYVLCLGCEGSLYIRTYIHTRQNVMVLCILIFAFLDEAQEDKRI
jgi:hypothetical protein